MGASLDQQVRAFKQLESIRKNCSKEALFRSLFRIFDLKTILTEISQVIEEKAVKHSQLETKQAQAFKNLSEKLKPLADEFTKDLR